MSNNEERAARLIAEMKAIPTPELKVKDVKLIERTEEALAIFKATDAFVKKWGISVLSALEEGTDET